VSIRTNFGAALAMAMAALLPALAVAQDYPTKPIQLYTAQPEGTADITARLIAQYADLGQPIVVNNRASALAAQEVASAEPDGYSVLILGKSFYLAPIFQETPYDPVTQFAPVAKVSSSPNILVTHPDMPATVDEIVALLKSKPGEINYATGASGGAAHLAAQQFMQLADVEMERVVYDGGGPSMVGVMSNESQLSFGTPSMVQSLVDAGKLRAVAVTSETPSEVVPGLPTLGEFLPGFVETSTQGIWVTAGTPPEVIAILNAEIGRVLALPDVKEKLLSLGSDVAFSTPDEFAAEISADIERTRALMEGSDG
jgi:tripartite-type tricarboxylate transporter receptor subunit TctC